MFGLIRLGITSAQAYGVGLGLSAASIGYAAHLNKKRHEAQVDALNQMVDAFQDMCGRGAATPDDAVAATDATDLDPSQFL